LSQARQKSWKQSMIVVVVVVGCDVGIGVGDEASTIETVVVVG
jgi:hypothetical protein